LEALAALQLNAALGEALDVVGDDRCLAGTDRLQEIAVRDEGYALPPRPIARREMRFEIVVRAEISANPGQQFLLHLLRFGEGTVGEDGLLVENFSADDLVDPGFVDLQPAQFVCKLDRVPAGSEEGRRA